MSPHCRGAWMRIGQLSLDFDAEADEEDDDAAGGEASADWVDPPLDPARVRAAVAAAEAAFNNALAIEAADDYEDAIAYFALGSARAKLVTLPESAGGSGGGGGEAERLVHRATAIAHLEMAVQLSPKTRVFQMMRDTVKAM